jgi:hypothetical protein
MPDLREQNGPGNRNVEMLAEALRLVSRDDEHTKVPERIETLVMRAWEARALGHIQEYRSHSRHLWVAALTAAACAVLVAALWFQRPAENATSARAPVNAVGEMPGSEALAYSLDSVVATEVVLQADPASLQVVRLTVHPSMLTALGYAFANPVDTEPVNVEVLIGLDGVPRAIRRLESNPALEH